MTSQEHLTRAQELAHIALDKGTASEVGEAMMHFILSQREPSLTTADVTRETARRVVDSENDTWYRDISEGAYANACWYMTGSFYDAQNRGYDGRSLRSIEENYGPLSFFAE